MAIPISLPCIGSRLPTSRMTANPMPGMSGISHAFSRNQPDVTDTSAGTCQPFISDSSSSEIERRLR